MARYESEFSWMWSMGGGLERDRRFDRFLIEAEGSYMCSDLRYLFQLFERP